MRTSRVAARRRLVAIRRSVRPAWRNKLPHAPVPAAIFSYIKDVCSSKRGQWSGRSRSSVDPFVADPPPVPDLVPGTDHLAFEVVSYLLGAASVRMSQGRGLAISKETFIELGADPQEVSLQVSQLVVLGVLERTWQAVRKRDPRTGMFIATSARYTLSTFLRREILNSSDVRVFSTWWDAANHRPPYSSQPSGQLDPTVVRPGDPELADAIAGLQQVGLQFDGLACRRWLRAQQRSMPSNKFEHRLWFAAGLVDGLNYVRYRIAASGRVQSFGRSPLQHTPRDMRQFFKPPEGRVFLDFDFGSQEVYLIAAMSGDEKLLEALSTDVYARMARLFRVDRDQAKSMVHGRNYGGTPYALAQGAFDTPLPDKAQVAAARKLCKYMAFLFPTSTRWLESQASLINARSPRTAYTQLGYPRVLGQDDRARNEGVSHMVQGTGAQILWTILELLPAALGGSAVVVLPMHDGLLVEVDQGDVDRVERVVRRVMDQAVRQVFPGLRIPIKMKVGW